MRDDSDAYPVDEDGWRDYCFDTDMEDARNGE